MTQARGRGNGFTPAWNCTIQNSHLSLNPNDSLAPARSALDGPSPSANSFRCFSSDLSPSEAEGTNVSSMDRSALTPSPLP